MPERPAANAPRSERTKADYVKALHDSGADCRDTVGSWAERRDKYAKQYEKENFNAGERVWRKLTRKAPQ